MYVCIHKFYLIIPNLEFTFIQFTVHCPLACPLSVVCVHCSLSTVHSPLSCSWMNSAWFHPTLHNFAWFYMILHNFAFNVWTSGFVTKIPPWTVVKIASFWSVSSNNLRCSMLYFHSQRKQNNARSRYLNYLILCPWGARLSEFGYF